MMETGMDDLVSWLDDYQGDVDHGAFREACMRLGCAAQPRLAQLLDTVTDCRGLVVLALADHNEAARLACRYPNLPGAQSFRRAYDTSEDGD